MDEPSATQFDEQIHLLEQLSARIRSGSNPERLEVDGALERGFGRLISLEAELQRVMKSAEDSGKAERTSEMRHAIEILREALSELRAQSSPPGPPRIGYGFVLPGAPSPGSRTSADRMPPVVPGRPPSGMQNT
jgi:hypothetical protein